MQLCFSRPHAWHLEEQLETTRNGHVLAHVETGVRTILADGEPIRMGMIAWVCCDPDWRGHNLASHLIQLAHELGEREQQVEFFGLFADIPRFYERLGYREAPNLGEWGMVAHMSQRRWNWAAAVDLQGGVW